MMVLVDVLNLSGKFGSSFFGVWLDIWMYPPAEVMARALLAQNILPFGDPSA